MQYLHTIHFYSFPFLICSFLAGILATKKTLSNVKCWLPVAAKSALWVAVFANASRCSWEIGTVSPTFVHSAAFSSNANVEYFHQTLELSRGHTQLYLHLGYLSLQFAFHLQDLNLKLNSNRPMLAEPLKQPPSISNSFPSEMLKQIHHSTLPSLSWDLVLQTQWDQSHKEEIKFYAQLICTQIS